MPDLSTMLEFFKAMANESRLRIVGLLGEKERSGQELAALLGLKEPTISHHLAVLGRIGLIGTRVQGPTHWHFLRSETLAELNRSLFEEALAAPTYVADPVDSKVLAAFVAADGTLTQIPASRRKRRVVLSWLVERFEGDRRYSESEVNEHLQRAHWDSATLRRELVGYKMMERQAGLYWRLPKEAWRAD